MPQLSVGSVPGTTSTVWTRPRASARQASVASRPLSMQTVTEVRPPALGKDLYSSPSWTWLMTFLQRVRAGLPE